MTNVIKLKPALDAARHAGFNDMHSANHAIGALADSLDTFAADLNAFGECLRMQTDATDQDRMLKAWHNMCDGLRSMLSAQDGQARAASLASP